MRSVFSSGEADRSTHQLKDGQASVDTEHRERYSVTVHQYRFLWAVQELVPEVLADLAEKVFPAYRNLFREQPLGVPGEVGTAICGPDGVSVAMLWTTWPSLQAVIGSEVLWDGPSWAADFEAVSLEGDRLKLKKAMERWAAGHYLDSEWIKEEAFSTLRFWMVNPHRRRIWLCRGHSWAVEETPPPKLHLEDEWNFEVWAVVNNRLREKIAVYRSDVANYCRRIGFDLERVRKDRAHHQWLALFQCKGMSPAKIRDWYEANGGRLVDATAISHGIEVLSKKIGLPRRRQRRGRVRSR